MGSEQALCEAAGLKECKTQKHRISHAAPDGAGDIPSRADGLNENGIDRHAHHNEKRLKRQREQRF